MFSFLLFIWNTLTPSFFKKACQLKSKKYIYVHSKTLVHVHIWMTNIFIMRSWKANGFEKIHTLCLRVEKTFFFLSILWGKEINFFFIYTCTCIMYLWVYWIYKLHLQWYFCESRIFTLWGMCLRVGKPGK